MHTTDERLPELLLEWEESLVAGKPLTAAELCRDCPDVALELERAIGRLQTIDRFLFSTSPGGGHRDRASTGERQGALPVLPGYEILEELGRGGMGIVYKARQKSLGRFVAVKTLLGGRWAQHGSAARLRQEAQALSRLNDPHVVQVVDVVETDDTLWVVLEYVEGESLERRLSGSPRPAGEAATLARKLARTLTVVHGQSIWHRDIKPANVLLDENGEPKISDFGLAKESGETDGLTETGELLGTLQYMAPEQAEGRRADIDARTDVYGLGATLYAMLTGRPPFQGASPAETLRQISEDEPVSPRLLNPQTPRDLETICLRCLDKAPGRRFASAGELADELERYLAGEPIRSRRIGAVQRLARWSRRRPAVAGLVVVSLAALVMLGAGLVVHTQNLSKYTMDLEDLNNNLKAATDAAQESQRAAEESESQAKDSLYAADMNRAAAAWREADTRAVTQLLDGHVPQPGGADRRGWEWWYLRRQADRAHRVLLDVESALYFLCFSPDQRLLAAAGKDAIVRLVDPETGAPSREIVTGQIEVNGLAFSPEGTELATAGDDGSIRIWNLETGRERLKIAAHPGKAFQVLSTPDGTKLVSCGDDSVIRIFESDTGKPLPSIAGHTGTVESIAISKDGELLASTSGDRSARTWELATGRQRNGLIVPTYGLGPLVLTAQNDLLITGRNDGCVQTWSLATNEEISSVNHRDQVGSLALHPDGKLLAAGDHSGSIRLWNIDSAGRIAGGDFRSWQAHRGNVASLLWSADGSRLLSAGDDGRVVSWDPAAATLEAGYDKIPVGHASTFHLVPRTSSLIVTLCEQRALVLYDWIARRELARLDLPWGNRPRDPAVSPDGRLMAMNRDERVLTVHRLDEAFVRGVGEAKVFDWNPGGMMGEVRFAPDSQAVAVPFLQDGTQTWELCLFSGPKFGKPETIGAFRDSEFAFAPDGNRMALGLDARTVLRDISTTEPVWDKPEHSVDQLAFSPDGNLLAIGTGDRTIVLRWARDGGVFHRLTGHRAAITSLAFSPDGRTLASASSDGAIKLWHTATGRELFELLPPGGDCAHLEFSSGGRHLFALVPNPPEGQAILVFDAAD